MLTGAEGHVVIVFGHQWKSIAQRTKQYYSLDKQTILGNGINSLEVFDFFFFFHMT